MYQFGSNGAAQLSRSSTVLPRLPELDERPRRLPANQSPSHDRSYLPSYTSTPTESRTSSMDRSSEEMNYTFTEPQARSTDPQLLTLRQKPRADMSAAKARKRTSTPPKGNCPSCRSKECLDPKHRKQRCEKHHRKVLGDGGRFQESAMYVLMNWRSDNSQTASNGKTSGLYSPKIDVQRAFAGVGLYCIGEAYCKALQEDRLLEFQNLWRQRLSMFAKYGPTYDLPLFDFADEITCDHLKGELGCTAHGHPDYRQCRDELFEVKFFERLHRMSAQGPAPRRATAQSSASSSSSPSPSISSSTKSRTSGLRRGQA